MANPVTIKETHEQGDVLPVEIWVVRDSIDWETDGADDELFGQIQDCIEQGIRAGMNRARELFPDQDPRICVGGAWF